MDNTGIYSDSFRYWTSKALFSIFMVILQLVILKCYLKGIQFIIRKHQRASFFEFLILHYIKEQCHNTMLNTYFRHAFVASFLFPFLPFSPKMTFFNPLTKGVQTSKMFNCNHLFFSHVFIIILSTDRINSFKFSWVPFYVVT